MIAQRYLNIAVGVVTLALILGLCLAIYSCGKNANARETAEQQVAVLLEQAEADSIAALAWEAERDSLRTIHVYQTDTAYVTRTTYRTIRDTIRIPTEMQPLVEAADSTIAACFLALGTCGERSEAADSLAAAEQRGREHWQAIAEAYRRMIPSGWERTRRDIIAGAVGASVGYTVCAVTQ